MRSDQERSLMEVEVKASAKSSSARRRRPPSTPVDELLDTPESVKVERQRQIKQGKAALKASTKKRPGAKRSAALTAGTDEGDGTHGGGSISTKRGKVRKGDKSDKAILKASKVVQRSSKERRAGSESESHASYVESDSEQAPRPIIKSKKGTLARNREIREAHAARNWGHEDDAFESTPLRSRQPPAPTLLRHHIHDVPSFSDDSDFDDGDLDGQRGQGKGNVKTNQKSKRSVGFDSSDDEDEETRPRAVVDDPNTPGLLRKPVNHAHADAYIKNKFGRNPSKRLGGNVARKAVRKVCLVKSSSTRFVCSLSLSVSVVLLTDVQTRRFSHSPHTQPFVSPMYKSISSP
eukprot:m.115696 g.115696  ORF g.115696 m.115696 type:complete len:349 (-) comp13578_c0_seq5:532-1578(-)